MHTFPGMTWQALTREMSFIQVMTLFERSLEIMTGEYEDPPDELPEDDPFVYNEELKRWECRTPVK